jgi:hypothetical protein
MKTKTIKAVLRRKHQEWVASIEDPAVSKLIQENSIITGGCIASMLLREKVNDFDVYFRNIETAKAVSEYYVGKFMTETKDEHCITVEVDNENNRVRLIVTSHGVASLDEDVGEFIDGDIGATDFLEEGDQVPGELIDEEKPPYRAVFISENAITLSDKIQIVTRFIGEPETIHTYYDFVHCTCYWQSWDGKLVLPPEALECLLTKELRYRGSKYPLCSIIRTRKFVARGWTINAGQYLKMAMQLNALDLCDLAVLRDQLTGVDVSYFMQIIDMMEQRQIESGSATIDHMYLTTIIDRLF